MKLIEAEVELTDVPYRHVQPASTPLFSQTYKETIKTNCVCSLEIGDQESRTRINCERGRDQEGESA